MPYSVALNQPRFDDADFGGMGQWDEIVSSIAQIGTTYLKSRIQTTTAQSNAAMAQNLAVLRAQQAATASPLSSITSSPVFLPLVGGLGLLLVVTMTRGRR